MKSLITGEIIEGIRYCWDNNKTVISMISSPFMMASEEMRKANCDISSKQVFRLLFMAIALMGDESRVREIKTKISTLEGEVRDEEFKLQKIEASFLEMDSQPEATLCLTRKCLNELKATFQISMQRNLNEISNLKKKL